MINIDMIIQQVILSQFQKKNAIYICLLMKNIFLPKKQDISVQHIAMDLIFLPINNKST